MNKVRSAPSFARIAGKDDKSSAVADTVADLIRRLGDVAPERILITPPIGTATEADVIRWLDGPEKRMVELIDGVLVEKPVATSEGMFGGYIYRKISDYAEDHDLGLAAPGDSPFRLRLGL